MQMRWRGTKVLLVGCALALVTAACHGTSTQPNGGTSASGATNATFTYSLDSQVMIGWDPSSGYSNEIVAMQNMYETLTRYDSATKTVKPLLAKSWTSSSDGMTWTFTLESGVTFHTGRPMTSADVKASIERTMQLNQGAAYIWGAVKSIDAPDPQTVVFHLKYPNPLDLVASADYAAYIFDTKASGSQDLAKWFESGNEAGTGPYQLDQWNKGQETELRLKAYPDYWGGWNGSHYQNVVFQVTPQATTAAQQLQAGNVSVVERLTPQLWQSFQNKDGFSTTDSSSWQTLLAMLNTQTGPLADVRVRQALAKGIDWAGMMTALHGAAQQISGIVPPGLWGHFDGMQLAYDQQGALDLLQQAGYGPGGKPMQLSLTYVQGDADEELVASLMKSDLKKLNIDLSVRGLAWPSQWAQGKSSDTTKRQDIFLFYWWPDYADPYSWFINLFHTESKPFFNLSYYSNPTLDKTMNQAEVKAASDRQGAVALYQQMQQTVNQDVPALSIYTQVYQRAMQSSVQGFQENPAYPNVIFVYDLSPA
jgi:peptide/nickel transport system substrate-binding protein